jgi:hypothetical protein
MSSQAGGHLTPASYSSNCRLKTQDSHLSQSQIYDRWFTTNQFILVSSPLRLTTRTSNGSWPSLYSHDMDCTENTTPNSSSIVVCLLQPLPNNSCVWLLISLLLPSNNIVLKHHVASLKILAHIYYHLSATFISVFSMCPVLLRHFLDVYSHYQICVFLLRLFHFMSNCISHVNIMLA